MTNILIVDDSRTMRMIQRNILQAMGFNDTLEAEDGVDALDKLNSNDIDLVLMDWNMPNKSGLDTLKEMKLSKALKNIPVIMSTSESEKSKVSEAISAGAANYITKPFKPEVFNEKIKSELAKLI